MADLAKQLVEAVEKAFTRNCKTDVVVSGIERTLKKNGVSYREAEEYSARLGELLAKAYQETITPEMLPNGKLDADLAEELMRTLLTQNYEQAAEVAARVQTSLNRSAGLGMKGLKPSVNEDRLDGLITKAASYESYDKAAWVLNEPVVNYTQSAVEDTIRKNADAHFNSGLHPKIRRISVSGCCKWCNRLAGVYAYPVKREVYKRHERCRCLVLYDPDDGKIQDAHSKQRYESEKAAIEATEKERRKQLLEEYERQETERKKEAREALTNINESGLRFREAKSVKEAEQIVRQICDTRAFGAVGVSYTGVDLGVANAINRELISLYDEFNVSKFGGIIAPAGNTKLGKMIDNATAAYSPVRNSFLLNRKSLKTLKTAEKALAAEQTAVTDIMTHPEKYDMSKASKRLLDVIKASKTSGRATVPETIAEVIDHEFGHTLEKQLRKMDDYDGIIENMGEYAEKISGYAAQDASEYIAESFASWRKGENVADPRVIDAFMRLRR